MTARAPATFYVLHGDDEFSLKAEVRNMRARMGDPGTATLNSVEYDGKTVTVSQLVADAKMLPFMGDKRLIIVEGLLSWLSRKGGGKTAKAELENLTSALPTLPDSARLVLVEFETLNDSNPVLKLAGRDSHGFHKAFNPPRDPTRWIIKQVESYGGRIDQQAAAALAAVIGSDLRAADSECVKLVTYVGGERVIAEADITLLTPYVAETDVWPIVDALGQRDTRLAATLIHRLLADPKQSALGLLAMINRQFRLLIQVREVLDVGGNVRELPDLHGKAYMISKLSQQARNFTLEQLENVYHLLLETDYGIKVGRFGETLALDLLVASLSA